MKWVSGAKQSDLRSSGCARQVQWGGVNGYEQARAFEQCRQAQQIELAGKIEYGRLQFFPNSGEMRALKIICATG